MIGCYDFCGHYEWTFTWLETQGGPALLKRYWDESIHQDANLHAVAQIVPNGIAGMKQFWGHTLEHEVAGYAITATDDVFRIDMHVCPSKGFLLKNNLEQHRDYCDHCIGWIGPLMKGAGFVIDHEHNHCGQCWWEMRRKEDATPPSLPGQLSNQQDVRLKPNWQQTTPTDHFHRANDAEHKSTIPAV